MSKAKTYGQFPVLRDLAYAYKLRLRRKRLLWRAFRKRRELTVVSDCTQTIVADDILLFSTVRNEVDRLPYFIDHYRKLGVRHFLFVDNASTDGTADFLAAQPDVSLWHAEASYKKSRFGVDWLTYLQGKFADGHWCITADADELLVYADDTRCDLRQLTSWLDTRDIPVFSALMLDMFPENSLGQDAYQAGEDPIVSLPWFSPDGYYWEWQPKYRNMSIRGGARERVFFSQKPGHAPHLNKTPLVRWSRKYVYSSSTHLLLPRRLNAGFDQRNNPPTGALLHTKFLNSVVAKSIEEKQRREHFTYTERYDRYYDDIIARPCLRDEHSLRYGGPEQLAQLGLISGGGWS
ncbi:glycosyltransferase family 2 protein [Halocynthiibacter namhaensis]|uniref:glycosyltransferase family 2 protein n=1 Tax=Halocynthiibacter namhaensis TaxID=1290553 RepID=UPI000578E628|nr:glycosyltransferase family 2 protein [Halocynthiibacter namhaensis]